METSSLTAQFERFRGELTGYCYRMLGSGFEAEDAVQETMIRAWRAQDRYDDGRSSLRTWLYRIATNVCIDMLRGPQRRAVAMDLSGPARAGSPFGPALPEGSWVQPVPDSLVLPVESGPEEQTVRRDSVRLAFVAALAHLPPRQRAVLILRDVLCWRAEEVADLLDSTVPAANSALQRARSTLTAVRATPGEALRIDDPAQRELLDRYCDAFQRHDVAALVALLHEDATMSMPPFAWWLRGREEFRRAFLGTDACVGARLIPVAANGSPAYWLTRPGVDGVDTVFALVILDVMDGLVVGSTTYLGPDRLFALFGRPVIDATPTHR